ncbi:alpha-latrocrustotoxin-Lt1a-like isoform X2 [Symsagittifera roscoffensis]|uniref:alpha-latrocrustotoxin-Lt1a-like isoform X2 n=1 Tax=Symsagittifera roscoffensis TaxID=84072 RepID=UPI00307CB90E
MVLLVKKIVAFAAFMSILKYAPNLIHLKSIKIVQEKKMSTVISNLSPQHQFFKLCEESTSKQLQENVKKLKEKKVDFNGGTDGSYKTLEGHYPEGWTGLHLACYNGRLDIVKYLVEVLKVDVNSSNVNGVSPLHKAACGGSRTVVKSKPGATESKGKTASRYVSILNLLLKSGAEIDHPDKEGSTALRWSAIMGFAEGAAVLLEQGADPMKANKPKYKQTSLHAAARYGNSEVLEEILDKSKHPVDINMKDGDFKTPLHLAVIHGKQNCVKVLMRHSADATIPDNDPDDDTRIGTTPLGYSKGNMRNLLKELMSKKSDGQTNESASKNKASSTETKSVVQKVAENEKSVENEVDSEQYHEDNIEKPENSEDKKSFDFFISYCHANKDLVNQIDEGLSKKDPNLKIWRDIRETSGGQALGAEIVQGIKNCRVFLAMFSSEYLQSDPCMRENSLADAHRKTPRVGNTWCQ